MNLNYSTNVRRKLIKFYAGHKDVLYPQLNKAILINPNPGIRHTRTLRVA